MKIWRSEGGSGCRSGARVNAATTLSKGMLFRGIRCFSYFVSRCLRDPKSMWEAVELGNLVLPAITQGLSTLPV